MCYNTPYVINMIGIMKNDIRIEIDGAPFRFNPLKNMEYKVEITYFYRKCPVEKRQHMEQLIKIALKLVECEKVGMQMINIAICDDDKYLLNSLEGILEKLGKKIGLEFQIETYSDGQDLVRDINKGCKYDIIYLDIEMKELNGIDTAKEIRTTDDIVIIIYVTNYESYAKVLFSLKPFEFIMKPVNENIFESILERAIQELLKYKFYYCFKFNKSWYKVLVQDIIYFESEKRTICIHTVNEDLRFYGKLSDIEKHFYNSKAVFWRIHQSYLVNFQYILKISYENILLMDGTELSISDERRKEISLKYLDVLNE